MKTGKLQCDAMKAQQLAAQNQRGMPPSIATLSAQAISGFSLDPEDFHGDDDTGSEEATSELAQLLTDACSPKSRHDAASEAYRTARELRQGCHACRPSESKRLLRPLRC